MSEQQEGLLINVLGKDGRLSLMMDKDDAGKKLEKEITERLIDKLFIKAED